MNRFVVLSLLLMHLATCSSLNGCPGGGCYNSTNKGGTCVNTKKLEQKLSEDAHLYSAYTDTEALVDSHIRWFKDFDYPYAQPLASIVLRPGTARDVVHAMKFATTNGLDFAVRSGGHGNGGKFLTEGGFLLDMRSMNAVTYDPVTTHVTVQGGATLNDISDALKSVGRSPPLGICRNVGSGILHGGWGASARKYGLTIDSVVAASIVTPDGVLRHVDNDTESDLFWAIRGDFSNFGVLVSVTYKTFDAMQESFSFAQQTLPIESFPKAAKYMNSQLDDRNVGGAIVVLSGVVLQILWVWGNNDGIQPYLDEQGIAPLGPPVIDTGYFTFQDFFYAFSDNFPTYSFGLAQAGSFTFSGDKTDNEFLAKFQAAFPAGSTGTGLFEMWAGAIEDVASDATAFYPRMMQFVWYVSETWTDPTLTVGKKNELRAIAANLNASPGASPALYINYVDNSNESLKNGFGANRKRLKMIKQLYDPENVMNHSFNVK